MLIDSDFTFEQHLELMNNLGLNIFSKYMKLIFMIMNHLYNLIKMIKNFHILNNKSKKS